ncbi:MAG: hypothetical protein AAGJ93_13345, partial [Bacteroidota bacterium]
ERIIIYHKFILTTVYEKHNPGLASVSSASTPIRAANTTANSTQSRAHLTQEAKPKEYPRENARALEH